MEVWLKNNPSVPFLLSFLIRDVLNINHLALIENDVDDRKKYLSFRVMDLISGILGCAGKATSVFKLEGSCKESPSKCVFFAMAVEKFFLILQFNDDTDIVCRE